ncbi:MAG: YggT family protein [Anaerolineae bacterium]|jgi:YggT family protein
MSGTPQGFVLLFLRFLASAFNICLLVRIFLPFFTGAQGGRLYQFVYEITEPVLGPIRRVIPPVMGLDFSPMIAMIVVGLLRSVISTLVLRLF